MDARKLGRLIDRNLQDFSDEEIDKVAATYHAWREKKRPASIRMCRASAKARQLMRSESMAASTPGPICGRGDRRRRRAF